MNDMNFSDKTVLVVGGSSGIGNATAQMFRARGADVHVWGTRASADDYTADAGSNLTGLTYQQLDVSDFSAVESIEPAFKTLDVLVLAQGTVAYQRAEYTMATFNRIVDVNLGSMMACATKFHPLLKSRSGALITISSTAAFHATPGNPAYNASKAGIVGLTRSLAVAWAKDGIRVNGVAPGLVATKLTKVTTDNPERLAAALQGIPARRLGEPEEIAGAVLFLASPLARYVVGQTLAVDGGLIVA